MTPFLTFYTPTYRRPQALAACLASVAKQTAVGRIQQIVVPDHIGVGVGGMYAQIPTYVDAIKGEYVHLLADDDELVDPSVVQRVAAFAHAYDYPELILVRVRKAGVFDLTTPTWPPVEGGIDLGCLITRADIWKAHVHRYGKRYEGDFDFAQALYQSGVVPAFCDLHFLTGAVMRGAAEAAA